MNVDKEITAILLASALIAIFLLLIIICGLALFSLVWAIFGQNSSGTAYVLCVLAGSILSLYVPYLCLDKLSSLGAMAAPTVQKKVVGPIRRELVFCAQWIAWRIAQARDIDPCLYKQAEIEWESEKVDLSLKAKALAISDGDPQKTKATYIALRAKILHHEPPKRSPL